MYDAIVIGVGAMGSAACAEMSRRGLRVLGIERFTAPNTRGSHHGLSRMFRMSYYEHADYVPLLKRAYELWHGLNRRTGATLFHETGAIYIGREGGDLIRGSRGAAERHGLPHEVLDGAAVCRRFPQFRAKAGSGALLEPRAGFIECERAVAAMAGEARRLGAEIIEGRAVEAWSADAGGCTVTAEGATFRGERLVFCGGAWTSALVRDLGVPLAVTRQVLGWVRPADPAPFAVGSMPCWAVENPDGSLYYGFPMLRGDAGLKLARHAKGEACDPDLVDRGPRAGDADDFLGALDVLASGASGPVVSTAVCLYTNSPDSHFIIDRHPRLERVSLACGFSGHGFKFAPVVGEILADLATRGRTDLPAAFLGLSRFAGGVQGIQR